MYKVIIMTNSYSNLDGFKDSTTSSRDILLDLASNIERPEVRRKRTNRIEELGNDIRAINTLVSGYTEGLDEGGENWVSQYVVDASRKGEDDILGAIRDGVEAYPNEGSEDSFFDTNIGIEYELNVPGIWDFSDATNNVRDDVAPYFIKKDGDLLVEQETGPITLELIGDIHNSIQTAVDAIERREDFAEHFLSNHNIPGLSHKNIRRHSGDHDSYHPGVHIHLDPEEHSNPNLIKPVMQHFSPHLGFLTANGGGEINGDFYLSERQAKTMGGGYPKGNVKNTEWGTVEIRVPDIPSDRLGWESTLGASIGLTKFAETQRFAPERDVDVDNAIENYYNGLNSNYDVDEVKENIDVENFNLSNQPKRFLSEGPSVPEMEEFLYAVEIGLEQTPYDTGHYMNQIEAQLTRQYNELGEHI